jgi:hypothetical protein
VISARLMFETNTTGRSNIDGGGNDTQARSAAVTAFTSSYPDILVRILGRSKCLSL